MLVFGLNLKTDLRRVRQAALLPPCFAVVERQAQQGEEDQLCSAPATIFSRLLKSDHLPLKPDVRNVDVGQDVCSKDLFFFYHDKDDTMGRSACMATVRHQDRHKLGMKFIFESSDRWTCLSDSTLHCVLRARV